MRIMILKVFVFACLLLLFLHVVILPHSEYFKIKEEYLNNLEGAKDFRGDCLMLGDSHGEILEQNTEEFECYNLSYSSDSIFEMYLKLLYVLRSNPNINIVMIPADFHLFQQRKEYANNQYMMHAFASIDDINRKYNNKTKYSYAKISTVFDPNLYTYFRRRTLRRLVMKDKVIEIEEDKKKKWSEFSQERRGSKAKDFSYIHFSGEISYKLVITYKEIIDLCKRNGIKLIAVRFPLSKEYRENIPAAFRKKIVGIYENFDLLYFFDYETFIERPELFRDQDHVNENGAKLLIKKLAADLNELTVKEKQTDVF